MPFCLSTLRFRFNFVYNIRIVKSYYFIFISTIMNIEFWELVFVSSMNLVDLSISLKHKTSILVASWVYIETITIFSWRTKTISDTIDILCLVY